MLRPRRLLSLCLCLLLPALALVIALAIALDHAAEEERIAEILEIRPGMFVADVGAGDGRWSEAIARLVGESGHVYANEIDDDRLDNIRERIEDSGLGNMSAVTGAPDSTMLPVACCDAILLRIVYHDMTQREEMRASLLRSLRPGGLLLAIEIQSDHHGIPPDELIADMTGDGFRVLSRHPEWMDHDDRYAVLFRAPADPPPLDHPSAVP